MDIELTRLRGEEVPVIGDFELSETDGASYEERRSLKQHGIRFDGPVHVDAVAKCTRTHFGGEEFIVRGKVTGQLSLACSRCLLEMAWPLDIDFRARFALDDGQRGSRTTGDQENEENSTEEGLRVPSEDLDLSFLPAGASSICLDEIVREQVLLDVPLRPLCKPDCAGLCDQCGAALAEGGCTCDKELSETDIRLAPLAELKKRLEGK